MFKLKYIEFIWDLKEPLHFLTLTRIQETLLYRLRQPEWDGWAEYPEYLRKEHETKHEDCQLKCIPL